MIYNIYTTCCECNVGGLPLKLAILSSSANC
jgi:hypothetical protein